MQYGLLLSTVSLSNYINICLSPLFLTVSLSLLYIFIAWVDYFDDTFSSSFSSVHTHSTTASSQFIAPNKRLNLNIYYWHNTCCCCSGCAWPRRVLTACFHDAATHYIRPQWVPSFWPVELLLINDNTDADTSCLSQSSCSAHIMPFCDGSCKTIIVNSLSGAIMIS